MAGPQSHTPRDQQPGGADLESESKHLPDHVPPSNNVLWGGTNFATELFSLFGTTDHLIK